jgi:hypothetical protein
MVSHDWSAVAVQVNVWSVADTDTVPLPPAASTLALLGLTEMRGALEASWLTVNGWPTPPSGVTVMVAVRALFVVFAAALHPTDPGPMPVDPDVTASHESLLTAVHCKEESVVDTVMVPVFPFCPALAELGLMLKLPPSCVTTNVAVAPCEGLTLIVAVRLDAVGLPATA